MARIFQIHSTYAGVISDRPTLEHVLTEWWGIDHTVSVRVYEDAGPDGDLTQESLVFAAERVRPLIDPELYPSAAVDELGQERATDRAAAVARLLDACTTAATLVA